jgi:pimeloyl-ACP methyl ester carboxylesterase
MFETLKKLKFGARVLLSRNAGQPETIQVNGRSTVLMSAGEGAPFVYLHSTLGESFMWLPFYQSWAKQFQVIVPTHPGFGQSAGFDQIDSIADMAFHYIELLDTLGLEQVNLGGVSLGGWLAAEIAVRWPERVQHLWIADAPGMWVPEQPLPDLFRYLREPAKLRQLMFHEPEGYIAKMILQDNPDEERMLRGFQSMAVLARLLWDRPYDPKLPVRLHRISCPVLLLWGDNDRLVPPAYGEAYRKHLPQAQMKLLKDCGHLPMFEREAEFVTAVTDFCKS